MDTDGTRRKSNNGWTMQERSLKTKALYDLLNISWAAFHISRRSLGIHATCSTALLPLFQESTHTVAMIKHSLDVIRKAVEHVNSVVTFDQPLYALIDR